MRSLNSANHIKSIFSEASMAKMPLISCLRLIFIFFISVTSYSQPKFKSFDTEYGLSSVDIVAITQDQSGYLWVGTQDGLNRFDGNTFKVYKYNPHNENSISSNFIAGLAVDKSNRIWMGHPTGITRFDPVTNLFTRIKVDSTAVWPAILLVDKDNRIWVGIHGYGLVVLNPETGNIEKRIDLTSHIEKRGFIHVASMVEDSSNNLWLTTQDGLFVYDRKLDTVKRVPIIDDGSGKPRNDFFIEIMDDKRGGFWLATYGGEICHYSPKQNSFVAYKPDIPQIDNVGISFYIDWKNENELWLINQGIGKSIGIFNTQTKTFSYLKFPNSFEIGQAYSDMFVDRRGLIWIASETGIGMINPNNAWNFIPHFEVDRRINIRAVVEDTVLKKKFLAADSLGLVVSNLNNDAINYFNVGTDVIQNLLNTSGDSLWVISRKNVRLFNKVTEKWIDLPGLQKMVAQTGDVTPYFKKILKTSSGDYWLATVRNGAYWVNGSDLSFKIYNANPKIANSICSNALIALVEDKFGRVWFASFDAGISVFDPASNTFKTLSNEKKGSSFLPTNGISDLDIDHEGNIWIGTLEAGLFKINIVSKDSLELVTFNNEQLTNKIGELKNDGKGRVWFRSATGVSMLDPKTMSIKFFERTGLFDLICSLPKSNDQVFVNGSRGYGLIDEKDLLPDTISNPLIINSIKVFGKEIFPGGINNDRIELPYDQNSFAIDFAAIDLLNNKKIRYSYKIEGLEGSEWAAPSRNRSTEFANLPGGDYIFKLKSSNQDGIWSKEKNLLYIHVETPFWKTKWFYASLSVLGIGIIFLIYWYQINRIRRREEEKGETNKRISQLQLKALHTQMRPHFIFNCLSAINGHIVKLETVKATEFLSQFSRLMRGILENSTESWISLEQEVETLRLYLNMEGLRFEDKFSYKLEVEESIYPLSILIPSMIIQPYVENAIDHGLLHKEHGTGTVSIKFLKGDGHLKCIIEDNGVGRERAKQIRERSRISRKSLGLQITSERLQLLQGSSVAEIQDLKNELGEATGTRIIVMLMTKKAQEKELTQF